MKTVRQRKDELIALIREKKIPPTITAPTEKSSEEEAEQFKRDFNDFRNLLLQNGIKNENLIATQLRRMLAEKTTRTTMYANLKFLNLLRSRLAEEGISLADAEKIMINVKFNMLDLNEDDDFIGDLALEFAEVCKIYYDTISADNATINWDKHDKLFDVLKIQLPSE